MSTAVRKYAGADWLVDALKHRPQPAVSELGRDVADVLGIAFCGIYHISDRALLHERTEWSDPRYIALTINGTLSTHDFARLSDLVFGCIQRKIRLEIGGASNRYLRLTFMRDPVGPRHPEPSEYFQRLIDRTSLAVEPSDAK